MRKAALTAALLLSVSAGEALACPDGQSEGAFGWCYPNIGGDVGKAWEKGKKEIANFEADAREWIKTGKCGGDICDAFAAAVQFGKDQVTDFGKSLERAGERLKEGKPLDAIWHLQTDYLINTQENAADAARRSRVLLATGQVAAAAYGGPGGAAAYTAWLTYNATGGNVSDALKAGIISGASAYALGQVNTIDWSGATGVTARAVLTGAVNGVAVKAAGGSDDEIRAAVAMGVVTVMIREGYRKLTDLELNEHRLRSSTGQAYCLADVPAPDYLAGGATSSCLAPPSAYKLNPDGTAALDKNGNPIVDFKKLDPDRPHVGVWAHSDTGPLNVTAENSKFMTGISRLPGWNAMAVAHDELAVQMKFDLLPGGISDVVTIGTIPPAVMATYIGTGYQIHDSIRDKFKKRQDASSPQTPASAPLPAPVNREAATSVDKVEATFKPNDTAPTETMHLICGVEGPILASLAKRTDVLVRVAADGSPRGKWSRLCEISQLTDGVWFNLGHAHYQINYCHKLAEKIAYRRQKKGFSCFASTGLKMTETEKASKAP